jgi:hypothetical protein
VRNPAAAPYFVPSAEPKKQHLLKPDKQHFAYMVQKSSPRQEVVVVARTRVIQPQQGKGKRPFGIASTGDQLITLLILFKCMTLQALQEAESNEAGHDV